MPSEHKRTLSSPNASDASSDTAKKARQETTLDIETLTRENADLTARLTETYAFIIEKKLVPDAPPSIKSAILSLPGGAGLDAYANSILARMGAISSRMGEETDDFRKTGVRSDNISQEVVPFLKDVKTILGVKSQPRRLQVAYDTVLALQDISYGDLETSYGDRPSDLLADMLLVHIATERRANGEVWDYVQTLDHVKRTSDDGFQEYGLKTFFPKAIKLFEGWQKDDEARGDQQ